MARLQTPEPVDPLILAERKRAAQLGYPNATPRHPVLFWLADKASWVLLIAFLIAILYRL